MHQNPTDHFPSRTLHSCSLSSQLLIYLSSSTVSVASFSSFFSAGISVSFLCTYRRPMRISAQLSTHISMLKMDSLACSWSMDWHTQMHDLSALWSSRFPWPLVHQAAFLYFCLLNTPGLLRSQVVFSGSFRPSLSKVALSFLTARKRALCLIMVAVHVRLVSENCAQSECPYLREVLRLSRFQRLHRSTFGAAGLLATNGECSALKVGRLKDD